VKVREPRGNEKYSACSLTFPSAKRLLEVQGFFGREGINVFPCKE
jgi:hypothetical protein